MCVQCVERGGGWGARWVSFPGRASLLFFMGIRWVFLHGIVIVLNERYAKRKILRVNGGVRA